MRTITTQTIVGRVSSAGVLQNCSHPGVSVRRTSAGNYLLRIPPEYRILSYTGINEWVSGTPNVFNMLRQNANEMSITIGAQSGAGVDIAWSFNITCAL